MNGINTMLKINPLLSVHPKLILQVNSIEVKNDILMEIQYLKEYQVISWNKKRGKSRIQLKPDYNQIKTILSINETNISVDERNKGFVITTYQEGLKDIIETESRYIHDWWGIGYPKRKGKAELISLDSDKVGWLMHLYLSPFMEIPPHLNW
jgi:hypothetical protein